MIAEPKPCVLEGAHVRLEPLSLTHLDGLCAVGLDPELWKWIPTPVRDREEMRAYVELALDEQRHGLSMPFATLLKAEGRVIGSTRYANISVKDGRMEIGWTWIGKPWQRSTVNTEAKYLMLRHAFETLGCVRVELKTDALNEKSRNAILRIGAKQEGIFRKHMLTFSGRLRDTVYFSILDGEWPAVKAGLEAKLKRA
ncbi:MAG TPA: GNAT family protein [Gammaproteobacteria bacterium]|nr:GNAT family protein [Gammaproteobacteria bacterium]